MVAMNSSCFRRQLDCFLDGSAWRVVDGQSKVNEITEACFGGLAEQGHSVGPERGTPTAKLNIKMKSISLWIIMDKTVENKQWSFPRGWCHWETCTSKPYQLLMIHGASNYMIFSVVRSMWRVHCSIALFIHSSSSSLSYRGSQLGDWTLSHAGINKVIVFTTMTIPVFQAAPRSQKQKLLKSSQCNWHFIHQSLISCLGGNMFLVNWQRMLHRGNKSLWHSQLWKTSHNTLPQIIPLTTNFQQMIPISVRDMERGMNQQKEKRSG